jgi:hypothetical protein
MSNGKQTVHPPTLLHMDNGGMYRTELNRIKDQLRLKIIESQCLADLGRKMLSEIRNKNATIAILQKRLAVASYSRRVA